MPITEEACLAARPALDFASMKRLHIVGCGTAHIAGRVSRILVGATCAELSVECRHRLRIPLSRSGARTRAMRPSSSRNPAKPPTRWPRCDYCKEQGLQNGRPSSTCRNLFDLARSRCALPTLAGPEIGVASTKAFTAQLSALAALAIDGGARSAARSTAKRKAGSSAALMETPRLHGRSAARPRIESAISRTKSRRRAMCSISGAACSIRSRSKAR